MLFPAGQLHLFFIGPQVSLPNQAKPASQAQASQPEAATNVEQKSPSSEAAEAAAALDGATPAHTSLNDQAPEESLKPTEPEKPVYLPNVYEPPTPRPIMRLKRTRSSVGVYGVPSYTLPYTPALTVTGMQASYMDVHAQFQETFDPYTDVFFLFSPGFGFPSPTAPPNPDGTPVLQIAAEKEWGPVLPTLLASKCAIFVTGFSPADVERDVKALSTAPGVAGEFDWVLTPGPNAFGSEKWEVADFDPRVMVKTNWGIWGIRGKRRDVQERRSFTEMFMS
jgi:splicing suppressor protein 51